VNQLLTETPKSSQNVSRRRQGFHSLRSIVKILSAHHKDKPTVSIRDLIRAIHGGDLQYYAPGNNLPTRLGKDQFKHRPIFLGHEEVFWKDINRWLDQTHQTIKYRFPPPNTYREPDGTDRATDASVTRMPAERIAKVTRIANQIGLAQWQSGIRAITVRNISAVVAEELAKDASTHGQRGPLTEHSVRKCLPGWKFQSPEQL
jgi:hypothetical protein